MANDTVEPLVDVRTGSKMLGVQQKTLRDWLKKGVFPSFKLGGRTLRLRTSDVTAFIERSRVKKA